MNNKSLAVMTASLLMGSFTYTTPSFGFNFSVDPLSSSIDGVITPDDILESGLNIVVSGTDLGLQDDFFGGVFDSLNALSYGNDDLSSSPNTFTVSRISVGLPGTAVESQSLIGEQGGSIFTSVLKGDNQLLNDPASLGLTPGLFGDALNSLSRDRSGSLIYFSIDGFSATNGFGTGGLSADILVSDGNGSFSIFADNSTMGLDDADDIDSLILFDRGTIGQLDPGIDMAIFSLSSFSPSTITFTGNPYQPGVLGSVSPADYLMTNFNGNSSACVNAPDQGVDETDGETTGGESGSCKVPEPSSVFALVSLFVLGILSSSFRKFNCNSHLAPDETKVV